MAVRGGTTAQREGQTFAGASLLVRYANFVKLPHTLFALPFALLGVVAASWRFPLTWSTVALVVLAFTAARFVAMGFNRIADRELDALNPRTRERELPTGRLTVRQAWSAVGIAAVVFCVAARALNPLCGWLALPALLWIGAYSYTKRFTHWSHLWLGLSLAIAPVGGYLAVAGAWSDPWWTLAAITVAVTCWVAGFDMVYALQDEDFDRARRLRSAVVRLGRAGSLLVARLLHAVAILGLVVFGVGAPMGWPYFGAVAAGAALMAWEHRIVRPGDLSRLDAAFFTANGLVSIIVFLGALVDRVS
ncbi:MAG TPA: 4-hydroxybenzoate octaprenyltransferase [Gemmatimonadales bacterium]|nr:4-hydroxybenzoate octaprenyltransferase [Gemmatimonadales bacterium]